MTTRRADILERLLTLAADEMESSRQSYHHYIPEALTALLRSAVGARPRKLRRLLCEAEALVANRGVPPRLRVVAPQVEE